MRQDNEGIMDRRKIDYVVFSRSVIGLLLDVRVLRRDGEWMPNHFHVERKLVGED